MIAFRTLSYLIRKYFVNWSNSIVLQMVEAVKYQWRNKHILIVEDDDSSSFLLGEILKRTGADLNYAATGEEAVDFIRAHPETDLVLMDIQLPDKDGITATREIKQINKQVYVITQSAYLSHINTGIAKSEDADDYITKPINPKLLLSKLDAILGVERQ